MVMEYKDEGGGMKDEKFAGEHFFHPSSFILHPSRLFSLVRFVEKFHNGFLGLALPQEAPKYIFL